MSRLINWLILLYYGKLILLAFSYISGIIKVSNDTFADILIYKGGIFLDRIVSRIETRLEVKTYIDNIKYALDAGAKLDFQEIRRVDDKREERYTNKYTMAQLFPNENPVDVLKRELKNLKVEDYLRTVKDNKFPNKSEMREFGKVYNSTDEVYIKVRVELLNVAACGEHTVFVMSFHFAEKPFSQEVFPYRKGE